MNNPRINLDDSIMDVMQKMCEGNPGALTVCVNILKNGEQIDPDGAMGGLGALLLLDTLGVYGSKIWMLFKDVCDSDVSTMLAVLRGWQLGMLTEKQIHHAIGNRGQGLNIPETCQMVSERLPNFKLHKLTAPAS